MKVRLIAPPYSNAPELVPPLGLLSIASYLKSKLLNLSIDIEVYDCAGVEVDNFEMLDHIINEQVDVVGLPIYSEYVDVATTWASYLREKTPKTILVAGGPHVSLTWKHFTKRWGNLFHYTISGDGEVPFTSLIKDLYEKRSPIYIKGLASLSTNLELINCESSSPQLSAEEWPNPFDAKLITKAKQRPVFVDPFSGKHRNAVTLVNSRSCPMRCSFCSIITVSQKWIAADVQNVIDWLCFEYERSPYEHIYFLDANFFVNPARVRQIAKSIKAKIPSVTWSALSTVLMFLKMKTDIPLLIESGLRMVELGIESGCQKQLDIMQKDCKVEKNYEAVRLLQEHGLRIGLDYIMFYPEQTIEDLKDNLAFLIHSGLVSQLDDFDHYFNALTLYPGTPLRTKYTLLFAENFDLDDVPEPDELFIDENIKRIYMLSKQLCNDHMRWIKEGLKTLRTLIQDPDIKSLRTKQKLRLDFISLKHLPFKILWHLLENNEYETLEQAMPEIETIKKGILNLPNLHADLEPA